MENVLGTAINWEERFLPRVQWDHIAKAPCQHFVEGPA